ncbi:uncharacterized protein LOC113310383 [Papaver somniferum]|uniref:uncharacterized protein LOC113310383 n=1 Tax=Papaver somniferum TaxID=3469 RepID=UPI000E6FD1B9|nr:uncharacterized protein LOC113310383 [Papaver somniferum]
MRCKKHITDRSSSVGVCASCLRERLFALVEAQARSAAALQQSEEDQQPQHQHHRKSDPIPPPLIFPRSVSPYICRRSDDSSWHQNQLDSRFYSTPQLGPSSNTVNTTSVTQTKKKKHTNRFSILSNLFRSSTHRSVVADEQPPPEQPIPIPIPDPPSRFVENSTVYRASVSTPSPISSTWYSSLIRNRRKTTQESPSRSTMTTNNNSHHHRRGHHRNKGLSPNCTEELERDFENNNGGVIGDEDINNIGGYLSESSPGWRKQSSTTATPGRQRRGGSNSKSGGGVSSMAFCLSPLVRASPKRPSRNQKDGFSGEIRAASSSIHHNNKPNLSAAASFCANRSRKLANFGRYNNYNP